jgi:hypothetical protein
LLFRITKNKYNRKTSLRFSYKIFFKYLSLCHTYKSSLREWNAHWAFYLSQTLRQEKKMCHFVKLKKKNQSLRALASRSNNSTVLVVYENHRRSMISESIFISAPYIPILRIVVDHSVESNQFVLLSFINVFGYMLHRHSLGGIHFFIETG